jgi:hypothetical protein
MTSNDDSYAPPRVGHSGLSSRGDRGGGVGAGPSAPLEIPLAQAFLPIRLERDEFRRRTADYLEPQIGRHGPILPVTTGRAEFDPEDDPRKTQ